MSILELGKFILELDAGHGGKDNGGTHNGILEKSRNLATAFALKSLLEKTNDFIVKMTREDDSFISLSERSQKSNTDKACLFISLHYNMAPEKFHAKGYEIYHYPKSPHGAEFAMLLSRELENIGLTKRFVGSGMMCDSTKGNYSVIQHTKATAILIEPEFLNNPEIKDWTPEKVALPIAIAIVKYFCVDYNFNDTSEDISTQIKILADNGLIKTPAYWLINAKNGKTIRGEYASALIKDIAKYITQD